ncbi:acyltransferase family protein [Burkholderia lata]|uniref:Acyltransferase n=1 Tax=Burkholderia lata (strain ATCC 17760 / DSM 23089 / LMG 22485 / NCIMB 9086 / R18194 / 383) TaxID=482957 RepID=A0A6P2LHU5_BURL3|nr:acyltransferase [Burkholderia lata]VWB70987.1 acyltransferase [Burkholderia lata]
MQSFIQRERYTALDGLRGIFAILVVALHFFGSAAGWTHFPFANADLAVDFFFMLSGFVLCHVYERGLREKTISVARFLSHRFVRMYPLHIASMIAMGVVDRLYWGRLPYVDGVVWTGILNVLLLQSMGVQTQWSWNGASWSISNEFWIGALFLPFVFQRVRTEFVVLAAYAGYLFLYSSVHTLHSVYPTLPGGVSIGMVRSFSGILLGVAIYRLAMASVSTPVDPFRFRRVAAIVETLLFTAIVYVIYGEDRGKIEFETLAAMPFLIFSVSRSGSVFARALSSRPMQWLGEISYSVYLVHFPLITLGVYLGMMKIVNPYVRFLIFVTIVLAVSTLVYRYFERPIYRRYRDAFSRTQHEQQAVSTTRV